MRMSRTGYLTGFVALAASWSSLTLADEWTAQANITSTFVNATSNEFIVGTDTKLAPLSCPDASSVFISPGLPYRQNMIDLIIAAQMNGRRISFYGACATGNPTLFTVKFVSVR